MTEKSWVPYDVIVSSETAPDDNYVEIDAPAPWVTGPDADGLLWIHGETGGCRGAVSVRAESTTGRAFAGYVPPTPAIPGPAYVAASLGAALGALGGPASDPERK